MAVTMAYKIVKMKVLGILVIFAFASIQTVEGKMDLEGLKKATKPLKSGCIKASGVDESIAVGINRGEFPEDPNLMCYLKCIFQKMKAMKNGQYSPESMITQANALVEENTATRLIALIEACAHHLTDEDVCRGAYEYSKCYWNLDSSMIFFPS